MAIAFDVLDAQTRHHRQILQQRDRRDIGKVLAAKKVFAIGVLALQLRDPTGIDNSLENAFAILVARPHVAAIQRPAETLQGRVRFVDDDRRPIGPLHHRALHRIAKRHIAVQRLLNEDQS